jgi:hypothetical protein
MLVSHPVSWWPHFGPQELMQPFQHHWMKVNLTTIITHLRRYVGHNDELALVPLGISAKLPTQVSDVTRRTDGGGCFR